MKVWIVAEDNITEMGKIKVYSFEKLPYWILLTFEDFETRHC